MRTNLSIFLTLLCFELALAKSNISDFLSELRLATRIEQCQSLISKLEGLARKGDIYISDNDYKSIIEIAQSKPFAKNILPGIYRWAGLHFATRQLREATQYFLEGATLYAQQKQNLAQALCYVEIALMQHHVKNLPEAELYYTKALNLAKDSLDSRAIITCYNGIALVHREAGKYDSAITEFNRGLEEAVRSKDLAWIGILEGNIGSIFLLQNEYDSSLYYYTKNLTDIKKTGEIENEIETYERMGRVYCYKRNFKKAITYLDSCVSLAKQKKIEFYNFFNPADNIYQSYAMAYEGLGNNDKAFEYYKKFHEAREAKQVFQKGQALLQLQTEYDFKEKQSELDHLYNINSINTTVINQQRYAGIGFIIVIILLAGFGVIVFYSNQERKKANIELDRLNQIKDKLLSVVSHDLRSPLSNLSSLMAFLHNGNLTAKEFNNHLKSVDHQLTVATNALENLLQWANSQMGSVKVHPENVNINKKTDKVLHELKHEAGKKNIVLTNKVPTGITAFVDRNQLEIILRNLLSNAIKFTPPLGMIIINAAIKGNVVEISVEDNGLGMDKKLISQLFKPGKQFTRQGTNQEKGTGIGLTIIKEMIVANGGDIYVESEEGKGSKFVFSIPLILNFQIQKEAN